MQYNDEIVQSEVMVLWRHLKATVIKAAKEDCKHKM